jgi:hypothetical protein
MLDMSADDVGWIITAVLVAFMLVIVGIADGKWAGR